MGKMVKSIDKYIARRIVPGPALMAEPIPTVISCGRCASPMMQCPVPWGAGDIALVNRYTAVIGCKSCRSPGEQPIDFRAFLRQERLGVDFG